MHPRNFRVRSLAATPLFALLAGCSVTTDEPPETAPVEAIQPGPTRQRSICFDGSRSVDASVSEDVLTAITNAMSGLNQVYTENTMSAVAGLRLSIRRIDAGSSLGAASQLNSYDIPPVIGLPPEPTTAEFEYTARYERWAELRATREAQLAEARDLASDAASQVPQLDFRTKGSELAGCIEAAAAVHGSSARILLVSDLVQTGEPQSGASDLTGVRVDAVHICAEVATCEQTATAFRERLEARRVVVQIHRPETADAVIAEFLTASNATV